MTRLDLPSTYTLRRSSRYWPTFSGSSQNVGSCIVSRALAIIHFEPSGAEPAGPSKLSSNTYVGAAPALGSGTAADSRPSPDKYIMLRRSNSGMTTHESRNGAPDAN